MARPSSPAAAASSSSSSSSPQQATAQELGVLEALKRANLHFGHQPITEANFADFTCFSTAYLRAIESKRQDRLFEDPFAERLAGPLGQQIVEFSSRVNQQLPQVQDLVAFRTKYLDDAINEREAAIQQIVFLAAGLDARAYRLDSLRGATVFEIDKSQTFGEYKHQVLQHYQPIAGQIHRIHADLATDAWELQLLARGFDLSKPTFWVMEGLLPYMAKQSIEQLVKKIHVMSAPGSVFWADMCGAVVMSKTIDGSRKFTFYGEDDVHHGVLSSIEWPLTIQAHHGEPSEHFGRNWRAFLLNNNKGEQVPVSWTAVIGTKIIHERFMEP